MEQYVIKGGNPLVGEVEISGAKNAALAILAAAIMTDETVLIDNLPDVNDINVMLEAISGIGATVQRLDRHRVKINGGTITDFNIEYDYIKKIRASYYLLGALLGKYKRAEVALPGGCNIGLRPIDQHIKGFDNIIFRPAVQSLHFIVDAVSCRQYDNRNVFAFRQNIISGTCRQHNVQKNQIKGVIMYRLQRRLTVINLRTDMPCQYKIFFNQIIYQFLVFHNKDFRHTSPHFRALQPLSCFFVHDNIQLLESC